MIPPSLQHVCVRTDVTASAYQRVQYLRRLGKSSRYVVVDLLPNGLLEFGDQEPGEVRWFPFSPLPVDVLVARWLLTGARRQPGWWAAATIIGPGFAVITGWAAEVYVVVAQEALTQQRRADPGE